MNCANSCAALRFYMSYFVYILASQKNGTLYIGMTRDLVRRVHEHKQHVIDGFTDRYQVSNLVWFDQTEIVLEAIAYEKRLKHWKREWKIELIEKENPDWNDLYDLIL